MSQKCLAVAAFTSIVLLLGSMVAPLAAKRRPPKKCPPVVANGVEYRAVHVHYSGDGSPTDGSPEGMLAYVEARKEKTKKVLWKLLIYENVYDLHVELDTQFVFITSLSIDEKGLRVTDESRRTYLIDLKTKTVREVVKPKERK